MNKPVKRFVYSIIFSTALLILFSLFSTTLMSFDIGQIFLTVILITLIVFINLNPTDDSDTKSRIFIIIPILLPALVYLPIPLTFVFILVSFLIILTKQPLIKKIFNISTTIISSVVAIFALHSLKQFFGIGIDNQAGSVVILFLAAFIFNIMNNFLVYCVISLEKGEWNKSSLLLLLIASKSTLINIFLGVINVYSFYYFSVFGLVVSSFAIFATKPLISHYFSQNNDLRSHTKLILTLLKHKDPVTYEHSNRVTHWTKLIAKKLGMSQTEIYQLSQAASWHDIGKIEIDSELLNRDGKLTQQEYEEIKKHPELGYQMVKDLTFFKKFLGVIRHHHEKMDGTGYPLGLKGEEIPYHARIVCVADSFDAMTMDRPYRPGMTMAEAVTELQRCAGTQFDAAVVRVFVEALKDEYGQQFEKWDKESFLSA